MASGYNLTIGSSILLPHPSKNYRLLNSTYVAESNVTYYKFEMHLTL